MNGIFVGSGYSYLHTERQTELATKFQSKLYEKEELRPQNRLPGCNEANENDAPTFLQVEVESIVKNLKNDKALGAEGIGNEQIKFGGELLWKHLTFLFNKILKSKNYTT